MLNGKNRSEFETHSISLCNSGKPQEEDHCKICYDLLILGFGQDSSKITLLYHINRVFIVTIIVIHVTAFLLLLIMYALADTEVSLQGWSLTAQTLQQMSHHYLGLSLTPSYPMWMQKLIHKDQDIAKVLNCNVLLRRDLSNNLFSPILHRVNKL